MISGMKLKDFENCDEKIGDDWALQNKEQVEQDCGLKVDNGKLPSEKKRLIM